MNNDKRIIIIRFIFADLQYNYSIIIRFACTVYVTLSQHPYQDRSHLFKALPVIIKIYI